MSYSLWPRGHRLLLPWDSPGKNTGVSCLFLLQGIFLTQGSNPGLPHCRQMLYPLSHEGSPKNKNRAYEFWLNAFKWCNRKLMSLFFGNKTKAYDRATEMWVYSVWALNLTWPFPTTGSAGLLCLHLGSQVNWFKICSFHNFILI